MADPTYVTIPDLTAMSDGQVTDNLLLEAAVPDGSNFVSRKVSKGQLVADIKSNIGNLSNLDTTDKSSLVDAINEVAQGGGGGSVSPYTSNPAALGEASPGSSDSYSRGDHVHPMPSASDIGAEAAVTEVTISTAGAVTQALDAGKIYHFTGSLTSLTITLNAVASGIAQYHFDFESGSTAVTLTLPNTVVMPSGFSVEANKRYEVDVMNNYGAVLSWANS